MAHHDVLARVQRTAVQCFQALHRQDIGTAELPGGQQTTIYRHRAGHAAGIGLEQHHRARAAVAIATAFFGAGMSGGV